MRTMALLVFSLALPCLSYASDQASQAAHKMLEEAILLAGPSAAGLPVVLAAAPLDHASRGVEAWTVRDRNGHPERIVVYSRSEIFRCVSDSNGRDYQCLLRLASAILHEAWHYRHGPDEADAYDAQIAFLTLRGGSSAQIAGVCRARDYVVAAQQGSGRRRR